MPAFRLNLLQLVSGALVTAALSGGVVYQVLVSNTVECPASAPTAPAASAPTHFFDGPPVDMTHGRRF